jgi:signal recognition particle subunit SRP72
MPPKSKDKPKPSPSQPPPPIEDLFSNLNRHIEQSEFEKAVKVADQGPILVFSLSFFVYPFFLF